MTDADDDDPAFYYGVLPICVFSEDEGKPPDPTTHREALLDISGQIIEHVEAALKRKDSQAAFRIMAKAERIVAEYIAEGFFLFEPLQQQLRDGVYLWFRVMRREFIRRALTEDRPEFDAFIKSGKLEGPGAIEDYEAVERYLDEGKALFDDLHKRRKLG
jgi:hypothetical protein